MLYFILRDLGPSFDGKKSRPSRKIKRIINYIERKRQRQREKR